MKGQTEPPLDLGIGKKVVQRETITPDWEPVEGKPDLWRHKKTGMFKAGRIKTPAEEYYEAYRKYGPVWPFFATF